MNPGGAQMAPCPHCRSHAAAEPSRSMRWICAVCGGPLVPTAAGETRSGAELANLVGAQRAGAIAVGWTAAAIVLGATAAMATGVGLLLWHASHAAGGAIAALGMVATTLAVFFSSRARRAGRARATRLESAWESVAGEILQSRGGALTATDLARALYTDETHAETLLSHLSAGGRARVAVTELADLSYQAVERSAVASDEADGADAGADARQRAREP
jgi:type IV secretory pathway TrbD component